MIQINHVKIITEFVNTETGEVFTDERILGESTKKTKSTTKTKKIKDEDPVAKITLLENKLQFNNSAIELTGFQPDDNILVQFEKQGRIITPVISANERGNRMTKTHTVSFRGTQHDTLAEYGIIFEVIPYEGKTGLFKLIGDAPQKEDDIVDVPEEIVSPDTYDDDLEALASDDIINFDFI